MITAMFFGDIIIKEYYSAGEVHVRDINNETEQGAIKYIFFLFSVLGGLFTRQGVCCLKKKKKWQESQNVPTSPSVQTGSPADLANLKGLSVFILALRGVGIPSGSESSSLYTRRYTPKTRCLIFKIIWSL